MTGFCWWLVDWVSRILEPGERDVVRGDFAESGITGGQALWELLGLVVRRQAQLWRGWRPWLVLMGIVVLVGVQLSHLSHWLTELLGVHVRVYWKYGVRYETGLTAAGDAVIFACYSLALMAWSWTSGFGLGSLSRRTAWVNASLFGLVWLLCGGPRLAMFSLIPQTLLLLIPFLWGARQGMRLGALSPRYTICWAAVVILLTGLVTWTGGWWQAALAAWSEGGLGGAGWQQRLLPMLVMSWPVAYMVAIARSGRREVSSA